LRAEKFFSALRQNRARRRGEIDDFCIPQGMRNVRFPDCLMVGGSLSIAIFEIIQR
jgi:hypothetical protein